MNKRICVRCGKQYVPTNSKQKYCKECRIIIDKKYWIKYYLEHSQHSKRVKAIIPKDVNVRNRKRRRELGFIPHNKLSSPMDFAYFVNFGKAVFHHLNRKGDGLYIPERLHKSIPHNIFTGKNMKEINTLAVQWWITQIMKQKH